MPKPKKKDLAAATVLGTFDGQQTHMQWLRESIATLTDRCQLWPFATARGYGYVSDAGRMERAHRVALKLAHCPVPPAGTLEVRHLCGEKLCINPDHLTLGTRADNERDKREHGRTPWGEKHWKSRLTADQVEEIRAATGSSTEVAGRFGVSPRCIRAIRSGRRWAIPDQLSAQKQPTRGVTQ